MDSEEFDIINYAVMFLNEAIKDLTKMTPSKLVNDIKEKIKIAVRNLEDLDYII